MAKKAKTNKSAAIREALKATPDKSAAEIAKAVGVTPALVYNVKANLKKKPKKAKGKPGRKPGSKAHAKAAAPHAAHAALDSAFEFVTKVGGLLHAEQLIAKLKSIKEKL
jgi:transposase